VAFGLFNFVGDPVASMLGQDATPEDRARLRNDLGLDQPFYRQLLLDSIVLPYDFSKRRIGLRESNHVQLHGKKALPISDGFAQILQRSE
jgi:hypothetical protein